jgi:hypothetical protein
MSDERFDYARKELARGIEQAAIDITWLVARETGRNIGCDPSSTRRREELQLALESFLRG